MEANDDSLGVLLMAVPFLYACLICNFMMLFGDLNYWLCIDELMQ